MKLGGLDDWVAVKTLWRLSAEAEARNRRNLPTIQPSMNKLINRPDLRTIARDLATALMIAGLVVLFF